MLSKRGLSQDCETTAGAWVVLTWETDVGEELAKLAKCPRSLL